MAKKTKLQVWTGNAFEDLFPETHISLINMDGGENLLHKLLTIEAVAKGAQQSVVYDSYEEAIAALNELPKDALNMGQNIYIIETDIPDLWISSISDTSRKYTYTSDEDFLNEINTGGAWVGYYIIAQLEGGSKAVVSGLYSQVTINGVHQPTWDADTKLDKIANPDIQNKVYGEAHSGGGTKLFTTSSGSTAAETIPLRNANGTFDVKTPQSDSNVVNKKYVDDGFLAKVTTATSTNQVYVKDNNGSQVMLPLTSSVIGGAVVNRLQDGFILVPTVTETSNLNYAANKNYVDNKFVAKLTTGNRLYANNAYNEVIGLVYASAAQANTIAFRDGSGQILVGDPSNEKSAVNKKYVDDGFVAKLNEDKSNIRIVSQQPDRSYLGYVLATNSQRANQACIPLYLNDNTITTEPTASIPTKTPTVDYAAANKKYVDDRTSIASNGTPGLIAPYKPYGTLISSGGILTADTMSPSEYAAASVASFISKGTLQNVINPVQCSVILNNGGTEEAYTVTIPAFMKQTPSAYVGACCDTDEEHVIVGYSHAMDAFIVTDLTDDSHTSVSEYTINQ